MVDLSQARVLILATDGFEQDELLKPRQALLDAGAKVVLAAPKPDAIVGEKGGEKGESITPDTTIDQVDADGFDALLLPGGVANPDKLRMDPRTVEIVQEFMDDERIVAAICHAPWLLVEADVVDGRTVTSWPSVRTDLANAGARVVDQEVVVDANLITSRRPDDIPAFSRAVIEALQEELAAAAQEA
jgi:protease I